MNLQKKYSVNFNFFRFAQFILISFIVIFGVIAIGALVYAYYFGGDKKSFVIFFASSILAYNSFLAFRLGVKK